MDSVSDLQNYIGSIVDFDPVTVHYREGLNTSNEIYTFCWATEFGRSVITGVLEKEKRTVVFIYSIELNKQFSLFLYANKISFINIHT